LLKTCGKSNNYFLPASARFRDTVPSQLMFDHRSILIGPEGVRQICLFIARNPNGVTISSLTRKFDLTGKENIRAAISILEEQGKTVQLHETVMPVRTAL
jgi:hypothetical protein